MRSIVVDDLAGRSGASLCNVHVVLLGRVGAPHCNGKGVLAGLFRQDNRLKQQSSD